MKACIMHGRLVHKWISSSEVAFSVMVNQRQRLSLSLFYTTAATLSLALLLLAGNVADLFPFAGDKVLQVEAPVSILGFTDQILLPSQNSSRNYKLPNPAVASYKKLQRSFSAPPPAHSFHSRAAAFFSSKPPCKPRFFMTWISKLDTVGQREFLCIQSIFKAHPQACLLILSSSMDSPGGARLLKPLRARGFRVTAMTPDIAYLLKNTPAKRWFQRLQQGRLNPGEIPLGQNLSNLLRLAVLYKFGGVYVDADVIVLKDFSPLRNVIGAQTADASGNWSRLNNAVLMFDKNHPLVYEFMREFALTFDGSKWGHNGPYLVSRVVERVKGRKEFEFAVAPPSVFYPVIWSRIAGYFKRPEGRRSEKWAVATLEIIRRESFAVHLWSRQSRDMEVEEGSLIERIFSTCCVLQ